jgi:isochorismate synthase
VKNNYQTVALAGTSFTNTTNHWGEKEKAEHQHVVDEIRTELGKLNITGLSYSLPYTQQAGQLYHIKADFNWSFLDAGLDNLKKVVYALHPTSATSGVPKSDSLHWINENEGHNRLLYAGFLGYVQNNYNADLYVNLRCIQFLNNNAFAFAGAGITNGSLPENEWQEIINKTKTVLLPLITLTKNIKAYTTTIKGR